MKITDIESFKESIQHLLFNKETTFAFFDELLRVHPQKESLLEYLNLRRFALLLQVADRSSCLRKFLLKYPVIFEEVIPNLWYKEKSIDNYISEIKAQFELYEKPLEEFLAFYRRKEMLRIFAKDVLRTAPIQNLLIEYSSLVKAIVYFLYEKLYEELSKALEPPLDENKKPLKGLVIGLGKLGSDELNIYSDIDLMFLYESDKSAFGSSPKDFFEKLFQKLFTTLNKPTQEGEIYITDLDLRPYGKSGPIALSIDSCELYYESVGRQWERVALLRSSYVAGSKGLWEKFYKRIVLPFVYKKHIDYKDIEELKSLKIAIEAQSNRKTLGKFYNVKTGKGGIREIEFSLQILSILFGGKKSFLRENNTFRLILKLHQNGLLSNEESIVLEEAYSFYRRLENLIQIKNCTQNHAFSEDEVNALSLFMGLSKEEFLKKLRFYQEEVRALFDSVLPTKEEKSLTPLEQAILLEDIEEGTKILEIYGFKNPKSVFISILSFFTGSENIHLSEKEKKILLKRVPLFLDYLKNLQNKEDSFKNFEKFLSNKAGKRIILYEEKEDVFKTLWSIFSSSNFLSTLIVRYPDTVEDILTLYQNFPTKDDIKRDYVSFLQTHEDSLDTLRRFKRIWEIRISLLFLSSKEEKLSLLNTFFESLSNLADVVLELVFEITLKNKEVCLFGLGKLGSKEISVSSDLDLTFVKSSNSLNHNITLQAQEFVRALSSHTTEGYLYSVDFRLRPMGQKGELVPSFDFYKNYFFNEARFWEKLSWTRSRFITGDISLKEKMEDLIKEFLFNKEPSDEEKHYVYDMRMKLENSVKLSKDKMDIKKGKGGIVDAEFIAQFFSIKEKIRESSTLKILKALEGKYSILKEVREVYMYLRLVDTYLRFSKEGSQSTISLFDAQKLSPILGDDNLFESVKQKTSRLREIFNLVFLS